MVHHPQDTEPGLENPTTQINWRIVAAEARRSTKAKTDLSNEGYWWVDRCAEKLTPDLLQRNTMQSPWR